MFTDEQLDNIAADRPINLFLAETSELVSLFEDSYCPTKSRCRVLAELVARWCLSDDQEIDKKIREVWNEWNSNFKPWYLTSLFCCDRCQLPKKLWKAPDGLPEFVGCLRERLVNLFMIDGFIPVYDKKKDITRFIPFMLDEKLSSSDIVYYDGQSVKEWQNEVRDSLGKDVSIGCRLLMLEEKDFSFCGSSLMLPIRMAYWRRTKGDSFPRYNVLRVLATGAFDKQERLVAVGISQKLEGLKEQFKDAILFGPDENCDISNDERQFKRLDCGIGQDELYRKIITELENTDCVAVSYRYILRRLPEIFAEVDRDNHNHWSDLADRLSKMKSAITRGRDVELTLQLMMMYITALCHAGKTEETQRAIDEAYSLATENNKLGEMLRLQIDAMVVAQDSGDVNTFKLIESGLKENLKTYSGSNRSDLLMRFYGTCGQMYAFCALFNIDGFTKEESLTHINKALSIACDIAKTQLDMNKAETEANIAQDLNYKHLWYALFSSGTEEEKDAYKDAFCHSINNLSEQASRTNLYYLKRQKSLALLNSWHKTGLIASQDERIQVLLPMDDADNWLVSANRRHLGALAAADGCIDEAVNYFNEGDVKLPFEMCFSPILATIRLTLLLQAASSLRLSSPQLFDSYISKAKEVMDRFGATPIFDLMRLKELFSRVQMGMDANEMPQFYY